jgi:hypothetical protein
MVGFFITGLKLELPDDRVKLFFSNDRVDFQIIGLNFPFLMVRLDFQIIRLNFPFLMVGLNFLITWLRLRILDDKVLLLPNHKVKTFLGIMAQI